jgi:hypothetical protein
MTFWIHVRFSRWALGIMIIADGRPKWCDYATICFSFLPFEVILIDLFSFSMLIKCHFLKPFITISQLRKFDPNQQYDLPTIFELVIEFLLSIIQCNWEFRLHQFCAGNIYKISTCSRQGCCRSLDWYWNCKSPIYSETFAGWSISSDLAHSLIIQLICSSAANLLALSTSTPSGAGCSWMMIVDGLRWNQIFEQKIRCCYIEIDSTISVAFEITNSAESGWVLFDSSKKHFRRLTELFRWVWYKLLITLDWSSWVWLMICGIYGLNPWNHFQ